MILGFDIGSTAIKIVAMEKEKILFTHSANGENIEPLKMLISTLESFGYSQKDVNLIALTGVGSEKVDFSQLNIEILKIDEINATATGAAFLTKLSKCVVCSLGTGTSIASFDHGIATHLGGSGIGGGTLSGLSKRFFHIEHMKEFFALAEKGDRTKVDLSIGDLFSGTETLPKFATASNLAKALDNSESSDWAKALINMVLECAGTHSALSCRCIDTKNVVICGGISKTELAKETFHALEKLYGIKFIIPENSDYATAIGAIWRAIL